MCCDRYRTVNINSPLPAAVKFILKSPHFHIWSRCLKLIREFNIFVLKQILFYQAVETILIVRAMSFGYWYNCPLTGNWLPRRQTLYAKKGLHSLDISFLFSHFCKRSSQSCRTLHSQKKMAQCICIKGESALHIPPCTPVALLSPHPDPLIKYCFRTERCRISDIC